MSFISKNRAILYLILKIVLIICVFGQGLFEQDSSNGVINGFGPLIGLGLLTFSTVLLPVFMTYIFYFNIKFPLEKTVFPSLNTDSIFNFMLHFWNLAGLMMISIGLGTLLHLLFFKYSHDSLATGLFLLLNGLLMVFVWIRFICSFFRIKIYAIKNKLD